MDMMDKLAEYTNGNTNVEIFKDGTKVRSYEKDPRPTHPESIDVKITDYCELNCAYCHEKSTVEGKHGDLDVLFNVLHDLPAGVELAIGGGNPLSHPDLRRFLVQCRLKGLICNITVNQKHLKEHYSLLVDLITYGLIKGLGISIVNRDYSTIEKLKKLTDNIVYHVIMGVNDLSELDNLHALGNSKVLVLGYKQFGRGIRHYSDEIKDRVKQWHDGLFRYFMKMHLSFDNLAITQMELRRYFSKENWERFYMGDDGTFTMYIDAIKWQFAKSSTSSEREHFLDIDLFTYFKSLWSTKK